MGNTAKLYHLNTHNIVVPPGISVIICCYNSAARLPETIRHLALQKVDYPWEIIVVDNASTDETAATAKNEWAKYGLSQPKLSIVNEDKPGLNHARMKGAQLAAYEYLIFCDDDNWLNEDYLNITRQVMDSDKTIGALGGECIPATEDNVYYPDWFGTYKNNYAVGKQTSQTGDITARGYLWGAGLVTTKTLFNKCFNTQYPSLLTDRQGNNLSSGGDTELCSRIILGGYRLYYDERLILKHFIPANRLTEDYLHRLLAGIDAAHIHLSKYYDTIHAGSLTVQQRITNSLKSLVKIIASPIVKKWDLKTGKRLFYVYTYINLGVDADLKRINKFKSGFTKRSS